MPRHIQKGGSLARAQPKKGGLRHGHESKKTGLVKKTILVADVTQKGVLGAYLLITLTRGLRHGSGQKRGVLVTGQARNEARVRSKRGGGLYCGTYLYWTYM